MEQERSGYTDRRVGVVLWRELLDEGGGRGIKKNKKKKWNVFFIVFQEKRNREREVRDRTWQLSSHKKKAGGCWELFVVEDLTSEKVDSRFY